MPTTAKNIIRELIADGWTKQRQKGSHAIFRHPTKPGRVVVPIHGGDLAPGTERSIRKAAGI